MTFSMIGNMARLTQTAFTAYLHAICEKGDEDSVLHSAYSSGVLFAEPAPALAGIHANRNAATGSAEFFENIHSIQAGRSKGRKNLIGITLAPSKTASEAASL